MNLLDNIILDNRHYLIYRNQDDNITSFLKTLEEEYKISLDSNKPIVINLDKYGLPKEVKTNNLENNYLSVCHSEYLNFTIIYNILQKCIENIPIDILNKRLERCFFIVNRYSHTPEENINNTIDLLKILNDSRDFWLDFYKTYVNLGKVKSVDCVRFPFIDLCHFIEVLKQSLNINTYFAICINDIDNVSLMSTKYLNDLIFSRNNTNLSIKVFTDSRKYATYLTTTGKSIQNTRDYEILEFDDSYKKEMTRIKKINNSYK